jgi:hypothetical protein
VKVLGKQFLKFIIELLNKVQILITQKTMKTNLTKMNNPQAGSIQKLIVYLLLALTKLAQLRKVL